MTLAGAISPTGERQGSGATIHLVEPGYSLPTQRTLCGRSASWWAQRYVWAYDANCAFCLKALGQPLEEVLEP